MRKLTMEELNRKTVEEFKEADKFPVVVILENIRSAYNVGSVFRTADAFLIDFILITGYTATPPHKQISKTALGAEDCVNWKYFKTTKESIAWIKELGYNVYAVEQVSGSMSLEKFTGKDAGPVAFIFGNEVTGVEQESISLCDGSVEIPQYGMKHSLNISVAAGIVLWEVMREKLRSKGTAVPHNAILHNQI